MIKHRQRQLHPRANVSDNRIDFSVFSIRRALRESSRGRDIIVSARRDYANARCGKETAERETEREKRKREKFRVRVLERGEKSYRTRRVFEVGCPVALIEPAISGPGEKRRGAGRRADAERCVIFGISPGGAPA